MAKQRRMRKMAKNVANQPKHKKAMAEFLADLQCEKIPKVELKKMLIVGHRGYLAMEDTKLGKLFDQMYDHLCSELKKAEDDTINSNNSIWGSKEYEGRLKVAKEKVEAAEVIYDEIFEEVFL